MHLLHEDSYWKVLQPLSSLKVNHLFARFVAEKQVNGILYVDDTENPSTFYIVHPYGMSLLLGDTSHDSFNASLRNYMLNTEGKRTKEEWLQAPGDWNSTIATLLGNALIKTDQTIQTIHPSPKIVEEHTRVNFQFNFVKYRSFRESLGMDPCPIVETTREIYQKMEGVVVPMNFWDNAEDFQMKGKGFSMIIDGQPVCTAYSAYIFEGLLELGIETLPHHRGKGYALYTCAALIDYCLSNNYEPIWSCRFENTASRQLAQKLGFEPTVTLPYYKLPV